MCWLCTQPYTLQLIVNITISLARWHRIQTVEMFTSVIERRIPWVIWQLKIHERVRSFRRGVCVYFCCWLRKPLANCCLYFTSDFFAMLLEYECNVCADGSTVNATFSVFCRKQKQKVSIYSAIWLESFLCVSSMCLCLGMTGMNEWMNGNEINCLRSLFECFQFFCPHNSVQFVCVITVGASCDE